MNANHPKKPSLSRRKLFAFKILAILTPVLFLTVLELAFRLFDYGHDLRLFITSNEDQNSWVSNPYVSQRYFSDSVNATKGNAEPFKKIKAKGTIRIFVIGESTTIGFPYMHNGSFHRWLAYRLLQMYPETNFEVINLSLTAVNSFTVNDIGVELVDYQPDAVCIYTGHNEYYGALGAGSSSAMSGNRTIINCLIMVRHYRLFQLLTNAYHSIFSESGPDVRKSLMERMVRDPEIPFDSQKYRQGIENFHKNISEVCKRLTDRNIPVFLSTIVSNEKDMRPFLSDNKKNAAKLYQAANAAFVKANFATAKATFIAAKDQDLLRFRAPDAINTQIINIAKSNKKVTLVDTYQSFERNTPHGIIGNELLLEHVHPNLEGYALISEAFFQVMFAAKVFPQKMFEAMSLKTLKSSMPITKVDSIFGAYSILLLRRQWPFNEQVMLPAPQTFEQRLGFELAHNQIKWTVAMNQLMDHYEEQKDLRNMLSVAEAVLLEYPGDPAFYLAAADLSIKIADNKKASNYLYRALEIKPDMQIEQSIYMLEIGQRHLQKALKMIDLGLSQTLASRQLTAARQILLRMIQLDDEITRGKIPIKNAEMVSGYTILGSPQTAKYYE